MMAMMQAQQNAQQQAALEAQKQAERAQQEAVYNSQIQSANQAGTQGNQQAQQQLGRLEQTQQASDASALTAYQQAVAGSGSSATGGAYDISQKNQMQMANLGASAGNLPYSPYNTPTTLKNPAATTANTLPTTPLNATGATSNQFNLPSTKGTTILGGQ